MLSNSIDVVVKRFMSDVEFRSQLQRDPQKALAVFSLNDEERNAVITVLAVGGVGSLTTRLSSEPMSFWY